MKITVIKQNDFDENLDDLIALHDEFLLELGSPPERTREDKVDVLRTMALGSFPTRVVKVEDPIGKAAGMSYYNFGTGYSCGGVYLWLNGIYIRPKYQKKGYGEDLIRFIEADAKAEGAKLFICGRAPENEASRNLFARMGFKQNDGVVMTKKLV